MDFENRRGIRARVNSTPVDLIFHDYSLQFVLPYNSLEECISENDKCSTWNIFYESLQVS
jgi:hypothetical protein